MLAIFFYFTYNIAKGGRKNMKIAKVGYGRDGRGVGKTDGGYAYLVNNNVRTGDVIQPIATSSRGRKFVTTGKVHHAYNETSVKGIQAKQEGEKALKDSEYNKIGQEELTQVLTGKEMSVPKSLSKKSGAYMEITRSRQMQSYLQKYPQAKTTGQSFYYDYTKDTSTSKVKPDTYEEYSKKFMKEEQ